MADQTPTREEWQRLFEAAAVVKALAPWQWMTESDIFGVQNPESGEPGFVSVMGTLGEHLAVAVYLGADGLYGFLAMEALGDELPPEVVLGVPQLQASFEDREILTTQDREVIKSLGLKFRGRQTWPFFRSFRPGFFPWYIESAEARFLTVALEQTLEIAPRVRDNPDLLWSEEEGHFLVRVPQRQGDAWVWEEEWRTVPPPDPTSLQLKMNLEALDYLKTLPRGKTKLELALFVLPNTVREEGGRPFYPHMLLMVETQQGMIIGTELLKPDPDLIGLWEIVPATVVERLAALQLVPAEIKVDAPVLQDLLKPVADALRFKLSLAKSLSKMPAIKRDFLSYMGATL
jgi:hypothetical protein